MKRIITEMGYTTFSDIHDFVYPNLVCDFFASVELVYKRPRKPTSDKGTLGFNLNGMLFTITIKEICEMYGFKYGNEAKFPEFRNLVAFWDSMLHGTF